MSGFSATHRPAAVAEWIKNARAINKSMVITNVAAFTESWWGWWYWINPGWRKDAAKPGASGHHWVEMGQGSWSALKMPGRNGFLSVLACLKWWRESIKDGDFKEWGVAVHDVSWAIHSLLSELASPR
jgi:hypothetical protein